MAIESRLLGNRRSVYLQVPSASAETMVVVLDAEAYRRIEAPRLIESGIAGGTIRPMVFAHVDALEQPTRWRETFCNPAFSEFLCDELCPRIAEEVGLDPVAPVGLIGLSLTGLAAAFAVLGRPDRFDRVLVQSPSLWWGDGQLVERASDMFGDGPAPSVRWRISVGSSETDENVDHGDGLIQRESQRSACRRMRSVLEARGCPVAYHEYEGGHDLESFRADLAEGLPFINSESSLRAGSR